LLQPRQVTQCHQPISSVDERCREPEGPEGLVPEIVGGENRLEDLLDHTPSSPQPTDTATNSDSDGDTGSDIPLPDKEMGDATEDKSDSEEGTRRARRAHAKGKAVAVSVQLFTSCDACDT
jgi:hypothetical protein